MGFFGRFFEALKAFFAILSNQAPSVSVESDASRVLREESPVAKPMQAKQDNRRAVQLLGALQREGRLVDFLLDEIDGAADADIGAAARIVHRGCRKVLTDCFDLAPIWPAEEGSRVSVEPGYDPTKIDVLGGMATPPLEGVLNHAGWQIKAVKLPELTEGFSEVVVQKAEIER